MGFKQDCTELCFDTEKEFKEFMDRLDGKVTSERNKQLEETRDRMKQIKRLRINGEVIEL